ncbi:hypothetical protein VTG60DRAFT_2819 [Thermothelomyces hinnuleus]
MRRADQVELKKRSPTHDDPDHIGFWDPLVESARPATCAPRKRKRSGSGSSEERPSRLPRGGTSDTTADWDKIERDFFKWTWLVREQEDRELENSFATELRGQLQALHDDYDAKERALKALEADLERVRAERERERAQEDEARRARAEEADEGKSRDAKANAATGQRGVDDRAETPVPPKSTATDGTNEPATDKETHRPERSQPADMQNDTEGISGPEHGGSLAEGDAEIPPRNGEPVDLWEPEFQVLQERKDDKLDAKPLPKCSMVGSIPVGRRNAPRIADEVWEEHKSTILKHRYTMTIDKLRDYMVREYNFPKSATVRQFSHRLLYTWNIKTDTTTAPKIADEVWEEHKSTILKHRYTMTIDELRDYIVRERNFPESATVNQFRHRLHTWKTREDAKNSTRRTAPGEVSVVSGDHLQSDLMSGVATDINRPQDAPALPDQWDNRNGRTNQDGITLGKE